MTKIDDGRDESESKLQWDLVDIGGRRLAISCAGEGRPSVVLETGLDAPSEWWEPVFNEVARFTLVCVYDRANRGLSDPAPKPRSSKEMIEDLHALLHYAGVPDPYVLVGQSLGGRNARVYAGRYQDQVAGLVLVDAAHPDQFERFTEVLPPPSPDDPPQLQGFRQTFTVDYRDPFKNHEGIDHVASGAQARAVASLGDMPLIVLTASQTAPPVYPFTEVQKAWVALQREQAALSANGRQIVVESAGHFIQRDAPQAVIDAIHEVVNIVRSQRGG